MASGTSAAPSLFLRNATGLVKGWSGFDAFCVLVHVGQPGHAGHVLQPGRLRLRPRREPDPVDRPGGDRGHVPGRRLRRAHRGDAAGRRRLHLAEPDPRRDPGHADRGRRRRGRVLPRLHRRRVSTSTLAIGAGIVGVVVGGIIGRLNGGIGFVLAATGWWFILAMWAPIYGAILNIEFFQPLAALVKSADGLSFFASQNGILFVSIVTIILTSALVALGMAGYARIQKWCLYLGLDRPRHHVRADAHLEPGRLQDRLRPGEPEHVRHHRRVRQDACRRGRQRRLGHDPRPHGHGRATCRTPCSRPSP